MEASGDPKFALFDNLVERGVLAILEIVEQRLEESLHLEFKTLSSHLSVVLTKDDRRLIAKSVCGLCNAEGGVLLLGIETTKVEGVDVACNLKRLENVESIRNRIVSALPEFLSPQHPNISVLMITEESPGSAGFIAINVPPSEMRPHMSIAHHQYFRRGSDGTRVLEHGEIKELMLAPREPRLSLQVRMRNSMSSGDHKYAFDCILSLRNEGKVSVRAPFIKAVGSRIYPAFEGNSAFAARRHPNGGAGVYADRGVLVHIEDELDIATIRTGMQFHGAEAYERNAFIKKILANKSLSDFSIRTWGESNNNPAQYDRLINTELSFGGEGVSTQTIHFAPDKWSTFQMMAKALSG